MAATNDQAWSCPLCPTTVVVYGSEDDTRAAITAVQLRHSHEHTTNPGTVCAPFTAPRSAPSGTHGKRSTYVRGCRCRPCKDAARDYVRDYRERHTATPTPGAAR